MSQKLVRDVMHRGVITCWPDETLVDVARRLREYSIDAIFVLDESGRAAGVVSQTDLARAYVQPDWQHLTAEKVMEPDVVTVTGDLRLDVAVQGGRTPNRPVGVLSFHDIVEEMSRSGQ